MPKASTIGQAIDSSGQTLSENYIVYMGSGEQLVSGGMTPSPWMY